MSIDITKINKSADASVVFLGFKGPFLIAILVLVCGSFVLWGILNAFDSLPIVIKMGIPVAILIVGYLAIKQTSQKLGETGVDKFFIKNKTTKIFHDNTNPLEKL